VFTTLFYESASDDRWRACLVAERTVESDVAWTVVRSAEGDSRETAASSLLKGLEKVVEDAVASAEGSSNGHVYVNFFAKRREQQKG
jgi:hypothetical protein